jgi:glc operon protein GlcG
MKTLLRSAAAVGLLAIATLALAQPPAGGRGGGRGGPPPEPSLMTYEMAATAMAAAEAYVRATSLNPMTIRIVDQNNNVVMVHRMQDANPFTATIAERKTLTVIGSKMTSAEYGAKVQAGEIAEIENAVTFGGGVPVYKDGQLLGAIAASGGTPQEDEDVSKAGVDAIGGSISAN